MKSLLHTLLVVVCVLTTIATVTGQQPARDEGMGPLRVHPTNPRYFTHGTQGPDGSIRTVYLTGSHTWNNLLDMGRDDPPKAFDFDAYLDFLQRHDHNFIRLWAWDSTIWDTQSALAWVDTGALYHVAPMPWQRTGPGLALDGKPKFDLERFDPAYFERLRERVKAAKQRGIYVSVMLFEGWKLSFDSTSWNGHPFRLENNIQGINGDPNGDGKGLEIQTMSMPEVTAAQEAYVRQVIDTVNDLDNVLYEISNEARLLNPASSTQDWQYHMIRLIEDYEAKKPLQHPVGMTSQGGGGGDDSEILLNSPADWISPNPDKFDYQYNPPVSDGRKVILLDTDHLWGVGGDAAWVWKSFLRGYNPLFMDPYEHLLLGKGRSDQWEGARQALGATRGFAKRIELAEMIPSLDLASTKYCLANPGQEYLVYQPETGEFSVTLTAGSYAFEWFNPTTSSSASTGSVVAAGGNQSFTAPFSGPAVLYLKVTDELPPQIQILQPGVKLTLLAEQPDLVTPTGLDVDQKGNIWLVASHTHFRPADYDGPEHDEILVFDRDGKNRRIFYNKTDMTMNLILGRDGWVYLALRDRILRVKDTDGDGAGDVEENIAVLDTKADYPHNGLSGMAWLPSGELLFSAGTNAAVNWTLIGRDGAKLSGRGEGGVFHCDAEGSGLCRVARGFWNPFGLLVRKGGEMFAVDNDAGSHPPCRLLNVIEGADYGYQRAYGPAPVHPFVAWNGELRGTLGMIHPSSEAPCAIVELGGGVMVPSWSSHCLDYFPLVRHGAGYISERVELLRGGDYFRPSFLVPGPDGSFYLTDWVLSSYPVHGHGRLWKLEIDRAAATWVQPAWDPLNESAQLAKDLREGRVKLSPTQLFEHARGEDKYLSDAALTALARESSSWTPHSVQALADCDRVWALVALRRVDFNEEKWVRLLLGETDPEVRFECLRWIADAVFTSFIADVEHLLIQPDLDYRLFEAALATRNTLRGQPSSGIANDEMLLGYLTNSATPARLKGFALRLAPTSHPTITVSLLRELLAMADPVLSLEVVRNLASRNTDEANQILAEIADSETYAIDLRAEAIAGLAGSTNSDHLALLLSFAGHDTVALREEALRALRQAPLDAAARKSLDKLGHQYPESETLVKAAMDAASISAGRPAFDDTAAWLNRLDSLPGKPNVETGRRIFHSTVAQCATCHRHSGRGNVNGIGPDLSLIARQGDRNAILRSILEPSREVAPEFYPTILLLEDDTVFTGILLSSADDEIYLDLTGKQRTFDLADIVERKASKSSLMPNELANSLTDGELRDLLAFLNSN